MMKEDSKYYPLFHYLEQSDRDKVTLTLAEIEALLAEPLPPTAHNQRGWWSNRRRGAVQAQAWMEAGYEVDTIDLDDGVITFRKPGLIYDYELKRKGNIVLWDAVLVRALRRHMDMTQAEFAKELGVRQPTVSEWETGAYTPKLSSSKLLTLVAEKAGFEYE
jgi:DNA-binding XRE family transcriptional regulator